MTDKPASPTSVFQTTPQFPDPVAAAAQLMKLAENADAAVRAAAGRAATPQTLPYDPFAVAKAFSAFRTCFSASSAPLTKPMSVRPCPC